MRILVAFWTDHRVNPFVYELVEALRDQPDVVVDWSLEEFWAMRKSYDIVHIHWPEYLKPYGESFRDDLSDLKEVLHHWSAHAKVVITRHNLLPLDVTEARRKFAESLYGMIYEHSCGIVHMGEFSLREYRASHPSTKHQVVIPHHIYLRTYSKYLTDKGLLSGKRARYISTFGAVRLKKEKDLLISVADKDMSLGSKMFVPSWNRNDVHFRKYPLKRIQRALELKKEVGDLPFKAGIGYLEESRLVEAYRKTQLVLIPRIGSLNSGLVTQSFLFGKVVVGTSFGNIGEMLSKVGCPIFDVNSIEDVIASIHQGLGVAQEEGGKGCYEYAMEHFRPDLVAASYKRFFKTL